MLLVYLPVAWMSELVYKPMMSLFDICHGNKTVPKYTLHVIISALSCFVVLLTSNRYIIFGAIAVCWRFGNKLGTRYAQQTGFLAFDSKMLDQSKVLLY